MRVDDFPLTILLVPDVSYTKRHVDRFAALVGSRKTLNAVGQPHRAVGHDVQREELDLRILHRVEEVLKVTSDRLSSIELAWRTDIVDHQVLAGIVATHQLIDRGSLGAFVL